MKSKFLRYAFAAMIAIQLAIVSLIVTLYLVIDTKKVIAFLEDYSKKNLGVALQVENLDFNPFKGFTATNITVANPAVEGPILKAQRMEMTYNPWALMYGTISLTHFKITRADLRLIKQKGRWNFEFQRTHSESSETAAVAATVTETAAGSGPGISQLIVDVTKGFFVPVRVSIKDIGFEQINVTALDDDNQQNNISMSDASARLDVVAFARSIWVDFTAGFASMRKNGVSVGKIQKKTRLKVSADARRRKLVVDNFESDIQNLLSFRMRGAIAASEEKSGNLLYDLSSHLTINTDIPSSLRPLLPAGVSTSGSIALDFTVAGGLFDESAVIDSNNPASLAVLAPDLTTLKIAMAGVRADIKTPELKLMPVDGDLTLTVRKNSADHIEYTVKGLEKFTGISLPLNGVDGLSDVRMKASSLSIDGKGTFPARGSAAVNIKFVSDGITIGQSEGPGVDLPFGLESSLRDLDGGSETEILSRVSIGELLTARATLGCKNKCAELRVHVEQLVPSIESLFAKIQPLIASAGSVRYIPEKLSGTQKFDLNLAGRLKNDGSFDEAATVVDGKLQIENINADLRNDLAHLKNAHVTLGIAGTPANIRLKSDISAEHVKVLPRAIKGNLEFTTLYGARFTNDLALTSVNSRTPRDIRGLTAHLSSVLTLEEVESPSYVKSKIKNSSFQMAMTLDRGERIRIDQLNADIAGMDISSKIQGLIGLNKDLSPKNIGINADVSVGGAAAAVVPGLTMSGSVRSRVHLSSNDMLGFQIQGHAGFNDLSVELRRPEKEAISLAGMRGNLPIQWFTRLDDAKSAGKSPDGGESEKIAADDTAIRKMAAAHLEKTASGVKGDVALITLEDYENVRDFSGSDARPLTIERLSAGSIAITDIEVSAAVRRNLIMLNSLSAEVLGGRLSAEAMVEYNGRPTKLKGGMHLTKFDTEALVRTVPGLRKKSRSVFGTTNPYVDANAHIQYDILNSDMSGGLNITSIGKDQLRMLMYYLDPTDGDKSISAIKTALNVGEVKLVSVPIKNGEIGVEVDVRLLSTPVPVPKIQGFPIAKLIENFQSQQEETSDEAH